MPTPSYSIGDQYLDSLIERHGREPSLDRDLLRAHADALKLYEDASTKLTATEAKAALAKLSSMEKLYATAAKARADVAETRASSSRVTSQNFQRAIEAAEKVDQELTMHEGVDTPQHEEAMRAFNAPGPGRANAVAYADSLTKSFDYYGKRLSADNPNIDVIMSRAAGQLIGAPLTRENRDRLIQAVAGSSQSQALVNDWTRLVDAGLRRREDMMGLKAQTVQDLEALKQGKATYESQYDKLAAGAPGSKQLEDDLQRITGDLGPRLMKVLGRSETDIAAERQLLVTENEQLKYLKEQADYYGGLVKRGEGADPIARLIGDPGFRQWAEGNGMRVGQVMTDPETGKLRYTPSADDGRAVALYKWQTEHPGRYSPIRGLKSTGARVRVTFEDPQKREDVLKRFGANGQFFLRNGALVSPSEARAELSKGGFVPTIEAAAVDGKLYLKKSDGTVVDAETGAPAAAPTGTKFEPAVFYKDGKVARYLTDADVATADQVKAAFEGGQIGTPDDAEKTTLQSFADTAPIKTVDESKVRSTWTNVVEGKLDARHASDYVDPSRGPDTISLDGGAVVIPGSVPATIEVREVPRRFALGDISRGWRRRMSEEAARRLDQQDIERGIVRLGEQERLDYAKQAQAALGGAPPQEVGAAPKVQIPVMTSGGVEGTLTTTPGSTPARVAAAEGRPVVPVETAVVRTRDGETYELTVGAAEPVAVKVEADGTRTPVEVNADLKKKLDGAERVSAPSAPVTAAAPAGAAAPVEGPAAPGVSAITVPPAEGPKVTFAKGAPQAIIDGTTARPSLGEEIGRGAAGALTAVGRGAKAAAEALLPGGKPPAGAAPGTEPLDEVTPAGKKPSLIDELKRRRREKLAAKDRVAAESARPSMPAATELPETAKFDTERMAFNATESPSSESDIGSTEPRLQGSVQVGKSGAPEVLSPGMSPEALKRAADAQLLGKIRQTQSGPNSDLAQRAQELERKRVEADKARDLARRGGGEAPKFDADAYAAEARAIADEARRRMRPPVDMELKPMQPMPARAEGLGVETAEDTTTEAAAAKQAAEEAKFKARAAAPGRAPVAVAPDVAGRPGVRGAPKAPLFGTAPTESAPPTETAPSANKPTSLTDEERWGGATPPWASSPDMLERVRGLRQEREAAKGAAAAPERNAPSANEGMTEVIRTTSPTAVGQYMQNVGDATKKKPSAFKNIMRRAFGKEEPPVAPEEAP